MRASTVALLVGLACLASHAQGFKGFQSAMKNARATTAGGRALQTTLPTDCANALTDVLGCHAAHPFTYSGYMPGSDMAAFEASLRANASLCCPSMTTARAACGANMFESITAILDGGDAVVTPMGVGIVLQLNGQCPAATPEDCTAAQDAAMSCLATNGNSTGACCSALHAVSPACVGLVQNNPFIGVLTNLTASAGCSLYPEQMCHAAANRLSRCLNATGDSNSCCDRVMFVSIMCVNVPGSQVFASPAAADAGFAAMEVCNRPYSGGGSGSNNGSGSGPSGPGPCDYSRFIPGIFSYVGVCLLL